MTAMERAGSAGALEESRPRAFTIEAALYVLVGLAALLTRFGALDGWPLSSSEAMQAWGAWNLANGRAAGVAEYSPLLMTGNWLSFSLLHASDAMARLWPALLGVSLALSPLLLRRWLGRAGALLAALILVFSPSVTFVSRILDGRVAALLAGVLMTAALFRLADGGRRGDLILGVVALTLGLLSAPMFYGIVLILLVGVGLLWLTRARWHVWAGWAETWRALRQESALWRNLAFTLAALLALLGTAFLFNLDGLGMAAGLLPAWLAGFARSGISWAFGLPLWTLLLYETLSVIFGVAGAIVGWRKGNPLAMFLGWWALAGAALNVLMGQWQPADMALTALPLALLAGYFVGRLAESSAVERLGEGEWLLIGVIAPLAVYSYIEFTVYARFGESPYLLAFGGCALIYILVAGLMAYWAGWRRTLRGVALGVLLLCSAMLVSNDWSANFNQDLARRDLFTAQRMDADLRTLVGAMERYSSQNARDAHTAPALVVGDTLKPLRWALRDFRDVMYVASFESAEGRSIILSPAGVEPRLGDRFSGQDIQIQSAWRLTGLKGQRLAKWLLSREPAEAPRAQNVILWVQRSPAE